MLKIYYVNTRGVKLSDLSDFYGYLSAERKVKIRKFRFEKDKVLSCFSELLVRYAVAENTMIDFQDVSFKRALTGKPFIENNPLRYNLSHSGDYVICAISQREVGIDIEKRERIDLEIAEHFHEKEFQDIMSQKDSLAVFYDYWCLKESYLKYTGMGLSVPLDAFQIDKNHEKILLKLEGKELVGPKLQLLRIHPDYSSGLCSESERIEALLEVDLAQLRKVAVTFLK